MKGSTQGVSRVEVAEALKAMKNGKADGQFEGNGGMIIASGGV